ncbi:hypothetical protein ES288_D12G143500v1 [Gossypium darwinii]|uniref:Uncharacterized protein n=1 Tax=Gossypium darwinii TaxID=34276 RepID=A0A5D2A9H0_GOSDA|nr:hypothetical protein ES288_D12G143500v1 [Gossypium darwinii]
MISKECKSAPIYCNDILLFSALMSSANGWSLQSMELTSCSKLLHKAFMLGAEIPIVNPNLFASIIASLVTNKIACLVLTKCYKNL